MNEMIIVDFSHLFSRNLFVAINQAKPKIKNGKYITAEIKPYFLHLLFNSLQYVKNQFSGEMVLALDARNNWRKDFYKDYKGNRAKGKDSGELNWDEIYPIIDEVIEVIKENFPFKVLKVNKAEADDIGGVLSQSFGNDMPIILVTSDHDWAQNLTHGKYIKMYDPIKKEYITLTDFENHIINTPAGKMSRFTAIHTLIGDSGDNVPNITFETQFSDNFLSYLSKNQIKSEDIELVKNMDIYDELVEKYDIYSLVKSGKRKGLPVIDYRIYYKLSDDTIITKDEYIKENYSEDFEVIELFQKDIFKKIPFGQKKAEKIVKSEDTLNEFLSSHKLYKDKFLFSNTLVDFTKIPDNLKSEIINEYKSTTVNYNQTGILNYFMNEGLGKQVAQVTKFYDSKYTNQITSSLDDFFSDF